MLNFNFTNTNSMGSITKLKTHENLNILVGEIGYTKLRNFDITPNMFVYIIYSVVCDTQESMKPLWYKNYTVIAI